MASFHLLPILTNGKIAQLVVMRPPLWAFVNGDYDAVMMSILPKDQAQFKKQFGGNPKRFKSETRKESMQQFKGAQILAKKILSADEVELKVQVVEPGIMDSRAASGVL